jgi:hypothetical protein
MVRDVAEAMNEMKRSKNQNLILPIMDIPPGNLTIIAYFELANIICRISLFTNDIVNNLQIEYHPFTSYLILGYSSREK